MILVLELDAAVLLGIHRQIPPEQYPSRAFLSLRNGTLAFEHDGKPILTLRPEARDASPPLADRFNADPGMRYDTLFVRMVEAATARPWEKRIGLTVHYGGPTTTFSLYAPGDEPESIPSP